MKQFHPYLLLFLSFIILVCTTCTKTVYDRRSRSTQTPESREFFGCRVNGMPFLSEASTGDVQGSCTYVTKYKDDYGVFQIYSDRSGTDCRSYTVGITLDSVQLEEGKTYFMGTQGSKKKFGSYFFTPGCAQSRVDVYTNDTIRPAQITITKFDPIKKVIMGTFYFVVSDDKGNEFRISDGIFDRHYTN
jgi:hypothetical protein